MRLLRIEPVGNVVARRRPVPRLVPAAIVGVRMMVAVRMGPVVVVIIRIRPVVPNAVPVVIPVEAGATPLGDLDDIRRFRRKWCGSGGGSIGRCGAESQPD